MHEEILSNLSFWDKLNDDEKNKVNSCSMIKSYKANTYLLGNCNCGCLGMIYVIKGQLRAFILSDEGREITLFNINEGDVCVLSSSCVLSQITFETQLQVTCDAEALVIPTSTFGELMENNLNVRCFAYETITKRFSTVMWVMQQILFYSFDKRLANFLIKEYDEKHDLDIKMTQEEIASATNSAREVVARMLKHFADDGLIEYKRGLVRIKNIDELRKL